MFRVIDNMSKYWGVSEEEEYIAPSVPEFIPKKRYEFKRCVLKRTSIMKHTDLFIHSTSVFKGKVSKCISVRVLRLKKR